MGKPAASISVRIQKLEASLVRARALKRSLTLDAKPMADLLGVNWVTLRDWCDTIAELETSQAVKLGGNGIRWEFSPRHTIEILIKHHKSVLRGQAARTRTIAKATGAYVGEDEAGLSIPETKNLVDMTLTVIAAQDRQGATCQMSAVETGWNRLCDAWVQGVMSGTTTIDPNGNMPPHTRQAVDEYLRRVCIRAREQVIGELRNLRADLGKKGTGGTSA